jgi:hypothetical protein
MKHFIICLLAVSTAAFAVQQDDYQREKAFRRMVKRVEQCVRLTGVNLYTPYKSDAGGLYVNCVAGRDDAGLVINHAMGLHDESLELRAFTKAWDEFRHMEESRSSSIIQFNRTAIKHLEQFLLEKNS